MYTIRYDEHDVFIFSETTQNSELSSWCSLRSLNIIYCTARNPLSVASADDENGRREKFSRLVMSWCVVRSCRISLHVCASVYSVVSVTEWTRYNLCCYYYYYTRRGTGLDTAAADDTTMCAAVDETDRQNNETGHSSNRARSDRKVLARTRTWHTHECACALLSPRVACESGKTKVCDDVRLGV